MNNNIARDLDLTKPDSIVHTIEQSLLADPVLQHEERPWQAFIIVASFSEVESAVANYKYDGILTLPSAMSFDNPAFDDELIDPLRELTKDREKGPWRTWVLVYSDQTKSFNHTYLWPGEDAEWNVIDSSLSRETAAKANPVDASQLDAPFSSAAAHWLHAAYARKNKVPGDPIIKAGNYCADRLRGGWRIYLRTDGEPARASLESIAAAAGGVVFLVADSTAVVHTTEDVAAHEGLLAKL